MENGGWRMKYGWDAALRAAVAILILYSLFLILSVSAAAAPSVSILIPTDGASIGEGEEVEFRIVAEDFLFVDYKNNTELYPGNSDAGQAIFWLDKEDELTLEGGTKMLSEDVVNLGALEKGEHMIVVELIRNDLSRFEPPVRIETNFSVGGQERGGRLDEYGDGIIILIALLSFVAVLFLLLRRSYRRFTRHSK